MAAKRIGYARVSTGHQKIESQVEALEKAGCELIYQDKKSGKDLDRESFMKMMLYLRPGDTLVVYSLDRLGRDLVEIVQLVERLKNELNVSIEALNQQLNFDTAHGRLIIHITLVFAQFERELMLERQRRGINHARARGVRWGREKGETKVSVEEVCSDYDRLIKEGKKKGEAIEGAARIHGISGMTVRRYLKKRATK